MYRLISNFIYLVCECDGEQLCLIYRLWRPFEVTFFTFAEGIGRTPTVGGVPIHTEIPH
jgi:hypothetical protein